MTPLFLILVCLAAYGHANKKLVCYFTNESLRREGNGQFTLETDADANLCTHIVYSYAKLNGTDLIKEMWWEIPSTAYIGSYADIMRLKRKNSHLKILLGVGGYKMGIKSFSQMAACKSGREKFSKSAIHFLRKYLFDGLSIDWMYPASRGGPPWDRTSLAHLTKDVFTAFRKEAKTSGKSRLLLTGLFPVVKNILEKGYNLSETTKYMDFVLLACYDFSFGQWTKTHGLSPLFPKRVKVTTDIENVYWAARHVVASGVPKDKLVIGIAAFGRSYTLANRREKGLGAPASGPGREGPFTKRRGMMANYEICAIQHASHYFHVNRGICYLVKDNLWIAYEDQASVTHKACYVKEENLAGVMIFALDLDDFKGQTCYSREGRYPLVKAAVKELESTSLNNCLTQPGMQRRKRNVPAVKPNTGLVRDENAASLNLCTKSTIGLEPHPTDLTKFYRCDQGRGVQMSCPDEFVFVSVNSTCEFRENWHGSM